MLSEIEKLSARLDKYLVAYREGNIKDIEYTNFDKKEMSGLDKYLAEKEAKAANGDAEDAEVFYHDNRKTKTKTISKSNDFKQRSC